MELIKITDLTNQLGISSRSLRYYEQVGLIQSVRTKFEKYRYYDTENIERLKQIMILRKMQIPIKDILRIYESDDMSTVVEVFVDRIHEIEKEETALTELKRIVSEFLQTMLQNGITKISVLPLLYDEMDKRLQAMEDHPPISFEDLSVVSENLAQPLQPAVIFLPAMRVISSCCKEEPNESDVDGFWRWVQNQGIPSGRPGMHERFDYQTDTGDATILRIPDDFENTSRYLDFVFDGGLFAIIHVYLDEDLSGNLRALISHFDGNPFYEIDYRHDGKLRHPVMLENLISPDSKREMVCLLIPVKQRIPDPALFDPPEEVSDISVAELESANPAVWETDAPLDKLTMKADYGGYIRYETLPTGEALFSTYVGTRFLSTDIEVKLPFRVDVELMYDGVVENTNDEGIRLHWNNCMMAVNERNNLDPTLSKHAVIVSTPVLRDLLVYYHRGEIKKGEYNVISWIVGEKYFAVMINGEVRLCLKNLPYMKTDLQQLPSCPILISGGGNLSIIVRKFKISQIETKMQKRKGWELTVKTKQSNNQVPNIQTFCVGERGENFAFDGACEQLMRCLGEKDYGYWLIAGITGDCFAQVYPKNHIFYSDRYCVSDYHILYHDDCADYIENVFDKMGYACTYVSKEQLLSNKEMYRQTLMAYIDNGIPVIQFKGKYSLICGYEEHGGILLQRYPCNDHFDKFSLNDAYFADDEMKGWIFIGEKKEQKDLAGIYRDAVMKMSEILTTQTDMYYFGAGAFRAWAEDIENGFYDGKTSEEVDLWQTHTSFVCDFETVVATAGHFLSKALELNPDLRFLTQIMQILGKQGDYEIGGLEDLGGGFNVTLAALQDINQRKLIAERLRIFAKNMDEVVRILNENL